jgi:Nuclease-related domain
MPMALERRTQNVAVREPGQYGREVLRAQALRWAAAFVALGIIPLLALLAGIWRPLLIALVLAVIVTVLLLDREVTSKLGRRARGVRGEQKVGRILDGLAASGWLTLHDVATGRGNIDHIAIGPSGVFAIETKSQRGRIAVSRVSRRWLAQAYAERKHLERVTGIRVDPLLVFSDAYLVGQPVSRRRGVLVLPARMLAAHLATRQKILTAEQVRERYARIVSALSAG